MGLVLSLKRGQDFYVEDTRVVVESIRDDSTFVLRSHGGESVVVTPDFAVELFPEVYVSASQREAPGVAKIVIEAPRRIGVILGDRYRHPSIKAIEAYALGRGSKAQGALAS